MSYHAQLIREAIERRIRLGTHVTHQPVSKAAIYRQMSTSGLATGRMWTGIDLSVIEPQRLAINCIMAIVSDVTGISRHDIDGPYREQRCTKARQIAYYYLRRHTQLSFPEIGKMIGERNHSTVMRGIERIDKQSKAFEPWLSDVAARLGVPVR